MKIFDDFRNRFPEFYQAMRRFHEESKRLHFGHGFDHDMTVAAIAVRIAPDERTAEKAWVAAMLHSIDRHLGENSDDSLAIVIAIKMDYLPKRYFAEYEIAEIIKTVLRHAELNRNDQSITQQVLMDADRLANVMLSVVMRAGQYYSNLPIFEFEYLDGVRNPKSSWDCPCSVLDNVKGDYQLLEAVRLPKARELCGKFVAALSAYTQGVEAQYRELGLAGIKL